MNSKNGCLIIDGNNLIYRAFYVSKDSNIQDKLTTTFLKMFFSILKRKSYQKLFIVFDKGKDVFRNSISEDYKKTRKQMSQELIDGFNEIKDFFKTIGLRYEENDSHEADDLIASFIEKFSNKKEYNFEIVSQDKDLFQLLDDNVSLIRYEQGRRQQFSQEDFLREKGFSHKKFFYYLSLVGDRSDNIKGVNGIGEVRAKYIVSNFEGIEDTFRNIELLPEEIKVNLKGNEQLIRKNFQLILLNKNVKIGNWEEYNFSSKRLKENKKLIEFCEKQKLINSLFSLI